MNCPVCRANEVEGPRCRRCRADLALLFALEEQRNKSIEAARRLLADGQPRPARALVERADGMRRDGQSQAMLALCHLLERDFASAWQCYARTLADRASLGRSPP